MRSCTPEGPRTGVRLAAFPAAPPRRAFCTCRRAFLVQRPRSYTSRPTTIMSPPGLPIDAAAAPCSPDGPFARAVGRSTSSDRRRTDRNRSSTSLPRAAPSTQVLNDASPTGPVPVPTDDRWAVEGRRTGGSGRRKSCLEASPSTQVLNRALLTGLVPVPTDGRRVAEGRRTSGLGRCTSGIGRSAWGGWSASITLGRGPGQRGLRTQPRSSAFPRVAACPILARGPVRLTSPPFQPPISAHSSPWPGIRANPFRQLHLLKRAAMAPLHLADAACGP